MSKAESIEKLVAPLIVAKGYELVDVQYVSEAGRMVLKLFIDKEGGISLTNCEELSRETGALVDGSGLVPEDYVLEVSSPGIDRVLKKESDFLKYKGNRAKISFYAPVEGQRNFTAIINSVTNGKINITDVYTAKTVDIEIEKIARARLDPDTAGLNNSY